MKFIQLLSISTFFLIYGCDTFSKDNNDISKSRLKFTKNDTSLIISKIKEVINYDSLLYKDSSKFEILDIDTLGNESFDDTLVKYTNEYIELNTHFNKFIKSVKYKNYIYIDDLEKYKNDTSELMKTYRGLKNVKSKFLNYEKNRNKNLIGWSVRFKIETLDARKKFHTDIINYYYFNKDFTKIIYNLNSNDSITNLDRYIKYLIKNIDINIDKKGDEVVTFLNFTDIEE